MKTIYFVRHGLTKGNEDNAWQVWDIPLSEVGVQQAQFVAERFKTIPVDIVVVSDMKRASQTAEIINEKITKKIVYSEFFREIYRPSVVRGKSKADPETERIMKEVKAHFADPDWHHSDEENFFDLKARAAQALTYLNALSEERILVVTHGHILRTIVALMVEGDALSYTTAENLNNFLVTKNTGITMVEERDGKYFLLTWNDHAHLGEVRG